LQKKKSAVTNSSARKGGSWRKTIRKICYWIIPVVVLFFIFRSMDLVRFKSYVSGAKAHLIFAGLFFFPLIIILGGLRWKIILQGYLKKPVSALFVVRHYWIGLAIGKFFPASIGWEIYRLVAAGREFGRYGMQAAGLISEKVVALAVAAAMILTLYPLVDQLVVSRSVLLSSVVTHTVYLIGIAAIFACCLFLFVKLPGNSRLSKLKKYLVLRLSAKFDNINGIEHIESFTRKDILDFITPMLKTNITAAVVLYSVLINVLVSLAIFYFFQALNTPVPFIIQLFLVPIFSIVLLLPISFGGLGIREGMYVLFYSLFGVPMETAVIVSFLSLTGSLVNAAIGGVIMFFDKRN
jgi:uncharacterized protein (TIRG00374 family)